jgi:hypothetical protein
MSSPNWTDFTPNWTDQFPTIGPDRKKKSPRSLRSLGQTPNPARTAQSSTGTSSPRSPRNVGQQQHAPTQKQKRSRKKRGPKTRKACRAAPNHPKSSPRHDMPATRKHHHHNHTTRNHARPAHNPQKTWDVDSPKPVCPQPALTRRPWTNKPESPKGDTPPAWHDNPPTPTTASGWRGAYGRMACP